MIKRLGHLAFHVKDMDASVRFYCEALGLTRAFELQNDKGEPWIVYLKIVEGQFIELFYGAEQKPEPVAKPIGFSHLCLEVFDIQETAELLKSRGVTLDSEPKQGKDGNWQCWAKDPDGNRIEFMQLMPGSPQLSC